MRACSVPNSARALSTASTNRVRVPVLCLALPPVQMRLVLLQHVKVRIRRDGAGLLLALHVSSGSRSQARALLRR